MKNLHILILFCSIILFSGCSKDEARPALVVPATYDGSKFAANTTTQIAIMNQLTALTTEVKKGKTGAILDKTTLENLFSAGNPSLSSVITPYYKGRLEGTNGLFEKLAKASGKTYQVGVTNQGGVFGTGSSAYLFDETGLDMGEVLDKGQFGATLYKHATDLVSGNITEATPDQVLAIFGANPAFPNSGSANVAIELRDKMMANYASRRDKNDGKGFYSQLKTQFIKFQAAVKAGSAYNKERDEAIAEIKLIWEKINAATTINYCHSIIATLSKTNPTDNEKASALHAQGECVGFIHGWRTIPQNHKKITDSQIDEILVLLNTPQNGTATPYKFATDPVNELPKLTQVINKLKDLYGFTSQDIEDFKNNWISVQNR